MSDHSGCYYRATTNGDLVDLILETDLVSGTPTNLKLAKVLDLGVGVHGPNINSSKALGASPTIFEILQLALKNRVSLTWAVGYINNRGTGMI